jgi:hypothetical protein
MQGGDRPLIVPIGRGREPHAAHPQPTLAGSLFHAGSLALVHALQLAALVGDRVDHGRELSMSQQALIILAVAAFAVVVVGLALMSRSRRRTVSLREHFGPEYDRVVHAVGDPRKAEAELDARQRRVEKLHIRPLPEAELDRYHDAWNDVQARFVEDPKRAVAEADDLVGDVMKARGYPVTDFDQRVADVSVDHPRVVTHYRAAHQIAQRSDAGQADTEELRQALIHYRALFEDLLGVRELAGVQ